MANAKQKAPVDALRKRFFAVMTAHGFGEARRRELIWGWTEGKTDSYTGMTPAQVSGLIEYVDRTYVRPLTPEEQAVRDKEKRLRSKLMKIATGLGLLPTKAIGETLTAKEWEPLNVWLMRRTAYKKPMKELTLFELGKVIDQLEEWQGRILRDTGKGVSDNA
jgi:hypothetical protein